MPKYWGKQFFAHGRFPEVGQKQKTHVWCTLAAWANKLTFYQSKKYWGKRSFFSTFANLRGIFLSAAIFYPLNFRFIKLMYGVHTARKLKFLFYKVDDWGYLQLENGIIFKCIRKIGSDTLKF